MGRNSQTNLETIGKYAVVRSQSFAPEGVNLFVKIEAAPPRFSQGSTGSLGNRGGEKLGRA